MELNLKTDSNMFEGLFASMQHGTMSMGSWLFYIGFYAAITLMVIFFTIDLIRWFSAKMEYRTVYMAELMKVKAQKQMKALEENERQRKAASNER